MPDKQDVSGARGADRFAFFGTPYVARDTLHYLVTHGFVPAVVVTSPDAPRGRGLLKTPSETKAFAKEYGIPVLDSERLDEHAAATIASYDCDYAVVVAYGKILPESLTRAFPKGVLNIHYSLLPRCRSAAPVEGVLLAGETVTGITIQKMARELDAGDIVAVREVPIQQAETTRELRPRLIDIGARLIVETLPEYLAGRIEPRAQDHARATRCGKTRKEDGLVALDAPPQELWNKYRAYAEWPGIFFFVKRGGKDIRVKITKASLSPSGDFRIERVIPEGKREMAYVDFSRGAL